MKLTVKMLPPYCKPGEKGEHALELEAERVDLRLLAGYIARTWADRLGFTLVDEKGLLTAEFMVNGRPARPDTVLKDGDTVTIIPYICGG